MNQRELKAQSEPFIRGTLRKHLQAIVPVYLYGSRARNTERWNSDYDLWIDADAPLRSLQQYMMKLMRLLFHLR